MTLIVMDETGIAAHVCGRYILQKMNTSTRVNLSLARFIASLNVAYIAKSMTKAKPSS